jgi:ATP-dependent Lon protease
LLEGKKGLRIKVDTDDVAELLGRRAFQDDGAYDKPRIGVVMGLAWTSMGGDTLFIEATAVKGSGFKQTGQLGKVMVESSDIAYTTARRLCEGLPACDDFFGTHFVHLHVPAGATPKDGPSAGTTMATALYSLATQQPIKPGFAMTGELNLSGQVMPVGGIKEKAIAARRVKVRHMVLPAANERDWDMLPDHVKKRLTPHFVATLDEVIALCFKHRGVKRRG